MKKTTVYVASPPGAFDKERIEISTFIQRLNNCYYDRGLFFSLVTREYIDHAVRLGYERDEKHKLLSGSAIALFLFDREACEDVLGDFNDALDMYKKSGWPKIAVYFKSRSDETGGGGGVKRLKERLAYETDLYYNDYGHSDTLLLGLMMQIKQLKLPGMDIRLENGKVFQGGEALLSFENAEIVSGYEELQRLKTERAGLESRFYAAKSKHMENPDDGELYERFREAAKLRNDANKTITDIESQLYQIFDGMFEQTSRGVLSKRQVESYRLSERGKLSAARRILDFNEILSDTRHEDSIAGEVAKRVQVNVNELIQLKDLNAAMQDWEGVDACYREAVRLEEKYGLPRKATLDYLVYLLFQFQNNKALELGERLLRYYRTPGSVASDEDKIMLNIRLGALYSNMQRMAEAEELYVLALSMDGARPDGDPDIIRKYATFAHNNLGSLYLQVGKYEEALIAHNDTLNERKKLAERDPDTYAEFIAQSYMNLGETFVKMENYEKAAENTSQALKILIEINNRNKSEATERNLALCSANLGKIYTQLKRYDEAEERFSDALELLSELAENNPQKFEPIIAYTNKFFADLHVGTKRYADAEEKFNASIKIFEKYTTNNIGLSIELAGGYFGLGSFLIEIKRFTDAENAVKSAIKLYEQYSESNPFVTQSIEKSQELLEKINDERNYVNRDMQNAGLTQSEINVARLLLNGESRSYITRHLHISAAEYNTLEKSIREKMNAVGARDMAIAAVAEKYKLTSRETDMLRYLSRNAGNDVIAAELHLTDVTVRGHIRNLLAKLAVDERQNLVEWLESYNLRNDWQN